MKKFALALLFVVGCAPGQLQIATQAVNAHKEIIIASADILHWKCTVRYEAVKAKIAAGLLDEAKAELVKFDKPCLAASSALSSAKIAQVAAEEAIQIAGTKQAPDLAEILRISAKLGDAVTALNKAAKALGGE